MIISDEMRGPVVQAHAPMLLRRIAFCLLIATGLTIPELGLGQLYRMAPQDSTEADTQLQHGLYLVLMDGSEGECLSARVDSQIVLIHDDRFLEEKSDEPPEYLLVSTVPDVPLVLAFEPERVINARGRPELRIALAEQHVERLRVFTERNLGRRLALVVAGQVVSAHRIRAVIEDGRLQITRCDEDACRYIQSTLLRAVPMDLRK
jgi:hypothetical protein